MEKKRTLPTALFWRYGLIGGLLIVAITLIQDISNLEESFVVDSLIMLLNIVVLAVVIFMGIKNHRDQVNDGYISTGRAFATGFFIAAIVGLVVALYTFINYQFINPGIMQENVNQYIAQMEDQGLSQEEVQRWTYFMRFLTTPAATAVIGLVMNIFIGLILSLITALILNRPEQELQDE